MTTTTLGTDRDHAYTLGRLDACLEPTPNRFADQPDLREAYEAGFRAMASRLQARAVVRDEAADEFPYADAPGGWGRA
ncbi:MAG: hypothetical protein EBZ59_12825 [Planctomycetia bacterium]|nr:hypothetical protein [Planctomycetia bacterium]